MTSQLPLLYGSLPSVDRMHHVKLAAIRRLFMANPNKLPGASSIGT